MANQEVLREMGYSLDEDSCRYHLVGAHRHKDCFPWVISKKMVAEMDDRDFSALKDLARMIQRELLCDIEEQINGR